MRTPTLLPVPDAAARLGISESALRRRLRSGKAKGERRPAPSGFTWLVWVSAEPDAEPDAQGDAHAEPNAHAEPDAEPDAHAEPERPPSAPQELPEAPGGALAVQRATEMAVYTERLLTPYTAQIAAQAEEIGRLRAELAHLSAAGAARPWWRRLLGG